ACALQQQSVQSVELRVEVDELLVRFARRLPDALDHERHEEYEHEPHEQHETEHQRDDRRKILEYVHPAASLPSASAGPRSDVEPEVNHVALLDDVRLAFEPELAGFPRALLAAALDVALVRNDLGANEAPLEVRMDRARRVVCRRVPADRPGPHFLRPGGIKRFQPEQTVRRANYAIQAGLGQAEVL